MDSKFVTNYWDQVDSMEDYPRLEEEGGQGCDCEGYLQTMASACKFSLLLGYYGVSDHLGHMPLSYQKLETTEPDTLKQ